MPRPQPPNDRDPPCATGRGAAAARGAVIDDLAHELQQALAVGTTREQVNELLGGALQAFGRLVPFDLAAVLELDGDELRVRVAKGALDGAKVRAHRLRLADFPDIRDALKSGRAVAFGAGDHAHGDGDPYDGVLDLPHGHHCMVVPLQAGTATLGAMTFDRAQCGTYPPGLVELAEIFGRLFALAMSFGEQTAALTRLRQQLLDVPPSTLRSRMEKLGLGGARDFQKRQSEPT